ncbi:MAG: hypothetical protein M0Z56_13440 [Desulfobacteraceae bacterium]|nr:hypothetical protein [Desulfobacteraceae bacterium]
MKINSSRKILFFLFIVIISVASAACAVLQSKAPEEALRERVQGMMQAKINKDWGAVYTYFDESFQKRESKEVFSKKIGEIIFKTYTIESIEILPTGKDATVKIKSDIQAKGFDFKGTPETQHWIMEGGEWRLQVPVHKDVK